jgi:hypothetical protein
VSGLVLFPKKITSIKRFVDRVERGNIKLRVRTLEVERSLFRAALLQKATAYGIVACLLLNTSMIALLTVGRVFGVLQVLGGSAAYCVVRAALCLLKLRQVLRDEANRYYNSYY